MIKDIWFLCIYLITWMNICNHWFYVHHFTTLLKPKMTWLKLMVADKPPRYSQYIKTNKYLCYYHYIIALLQILHTVQIIPHLSTTTHYVSLL